MSVYITGDTHAYIDIPKLYTKNFKEGNKLTENDFVIICGDFGFFWDGSETEKYFQKWFAEKPYITLFCDGNHENFNLLSEIPIVDFMGGKAGKVNDHLYHLLRGECYIIDGKKFFVMGGATSSDKQLRVENESWWPQEMPNDEEFNHAIETIKKNHYKFDYIISHCAPDSVVDKLSYGFYEHDKLTNFFEHKVKNECDFKQWHFGHYHLDKVYTIDGKEYHCHYNEIEKVIE